MNLGDSKVTQQSRASAGLDVESDLRVRLLQQVRTAGREASWVDALVGLNYDVPFGSKWRYTLRGDIGGLGADLTWHAMTKFTYQSSERFGWHAADRNSTT